MAKYLGEEGVDINIHPIYSKYGPNDWAMEFITRYGWIDGAHHKTWVLDQVARILLGTPVIVTKAKWDDGNEEYRIVLDSPSEAYITWAGIDENHDTGIAP